MILYQDIFLIHFLSVPFTRTWNQSCLSDDNTYFDIWLLVSLSSIHYTGIHRHATFLNTYSTYNGQSGLVAIPEMLGFLYAFIFCGLAHLHELLNLCAWQSPFLLHICSLLVVLFNRGLGLEVIRYTRVFFFLFMIMTSKTTEMLNLKKDWIPV